jgi:hypothetical protein
MTDEERKVILPYIVRILNAKLLKKKGKAANKPLEAKRTIVYRFLTSLENEDLGVFIAQVIEPFNLTIEDTKDQKILTQKLSQCSFSQYLAFISAFESIVKQMGSLVQDYLPSLCNVLSTIFKLSKSFYSMSKDALNDGSIQEIGNEESDNEDDSDIEDEGKDAHIDSLKRNTLKSCHQTLVQYLKLVSQIYQKYNYNIYVTEEFSTVTLNLLDTHINQLHSQNIHSKSTLMGIFTVWSEYRNLHQLFWRCDVIDKLCDILSIEKDIVHYEVYEEIFQIISNLVVSSTQPDEPEEMEDVEDEVKTIIIGKSP